MRVYQFRHVGTATADNDITDCLLRDRLLVPTEGLEPPHLAAHGPEPCASTNSATWALGLLTTILPATCDYLKPLVPTEGLEPPHLAAHGPEPCASTNSATWALQLHELYNR